MFCCLSISVATSLTKQRLKVREAKLSSENVRNAIMLLAMEYVPNKVGNSGPSTHGYFVITSLKKYTLPDQNLCILYFNLFIT